MRQVATLCARHQAADLQVALIPILIECTTLASLYARGARDTDDLLALYLSHRSGAHSAQYIFLKEAVRLKSAILLVDGLDEAGPAKADLVRWLSKSKYPFVVISSRPQGINAHLKTFKALDFRIFGCSALTEQQVAKIARLRSGGGENCKPEHLEMISSPAFAGLAANPQLLTMLMHAISSGLEDLTRVRLYEYAVSALSARVDSAVRPASVRAV